MSWSDRVKTALDNGGDPLVIKIEQVLLDFGVRKPEYVLVTAVEEYVYLRTAILWAVTDSQYQKKLTRPFYTAIAKKYQRDGFLATTNIVERAITTNLDDAWIRTERAQWEAYFNLPADRKNRPTNFQFILTVAKALRQDA